MSQNVERYNQVRKTKSSISRPSRLISFTENLPTGEKRFQHTTSLPVSVSESFTAMETLNCEGSKCFGDSQSSISDDGMSKSPVNEKDLELLSEFLISQAKSKPSISSSKVIHIDITPAIGNGGTKESLFRHSDTQHVHEVKVFENKKGDPVHQAISDCSLNKSVSPHEKDRYSLSNTTDFSGDGNLLYSSTESVVERPVKWQNRSDSFRSTNETRVKQKLPVKLCHTRMKSELRTDAHTEISDVTKETAESFAQTETWDQRKDRKSKMKRNLQDLFFACAGFCI